MGCLPHFPVGRVLTAQLHTHTHRHTHTHKHTHTNLHVHKCTQFLADKRQADALQDKLAAAQKRLKADPSQPELREAVQKLEQACSRAGQRCVWLWPTVS